MCVCMSIYTYRVNRSLQHKTLRLLSSSRFQFSRPIMNTAAILFFTEALSLTPWASQPFLVTVLSAAAAIRNLPIPF